MFTGLAAAGLGALANLGGGFMSAQGAASANAANLAQANMMNQQMLNMEMAKHEQNTAFMNMQHAWNMEAMDESQRFNAAEAEKARLFSSNEAGRQMSFQQKTLDQQQGFQSYLAHTAYQRAMGDMKKAGLNPVLAYQQGGAPMASGGSAGGAMGSGQAVSSSPASHGAGSSTGSANLKGANILNEKGDLGRAIGNAVSSAVDTLKTLEGVELMKQQEKESVAREKNLDYDSNKKDMETIKVGREAERVLADIELIKAQTKTANEVSKTAAGEADNMSRYGKKEAPDTIERMLRTLQGIIEKTGGRLE